MYVNYEIPTGTIDGVNKVFTTLNTPDQSQPLNLWFDGAIYTDFTIIGNVITLVDAPETSIFVSYATGTTNSTTTGQDTLGDIVTEVWDLLAQTSNSTIFSRDKVAKKVNAKIREVLRGRVTSLLDSNRIYRCGKIDIMEGKTGYRIQGTTKLTADFNIGDTIAETNTSTLYPAGYVQIGADIIKYTGITSTELQGTTGQTVQHLESESIVQIYEMPADFEKVNSVVKVYSQNGLKELEIPYDSTETYQFYYNVYKVGTKTLLKIGGLNYLDQIQVDYTKVYYDMVNDVDECILPDNYGIKVIAPLVAGEYAFQKGFPTSQTILSSGYTALQNMYQFFANTITITKQSIKPISYGFSSIKR